MQLVRTLLTAFSLIPLALGQAAADPTAPVTVVPAPAEPGPLNSPGVRLVKALKPNYSEQEYFVSGTATIYNYATNPPVRGDIVAIDELPYTTRMIVRRPQRAAHFNGTVVIEWWNTTATFDTAPTWDASAEYFARKGIVYVGVTNSSQVLPYLKLGCRILGLGPANCGEGRYDALSIPENGQAYEMLSQIATLLKSDSPANPLSEGFEVERIFHAGYSQQGGSLVTYASAFHIDVNDGYFIQASGSSARDINFGPECDEPGSPPFPDCTPDLVGDDRRVATDLSVPVYRAHAETDMSGVLASGSRQADTDTFHYYEIPGTGHITVHEDIEIFPAGTFPMTFPDAILLGEICELPMNTLADGPVLGSLVFNALWESMERQVIFGEAPPRGELIEVEEGQIARDEFGNARGGVRLPNLDVPVASYGPNNALDPALDGVLPGIAVIFGDLFCRLSATAVPLDAETLDALYPRRRDYLTQIRERIDALVAERFVLPEDVKKLEAELRKALRLNRSG